VSLLKAGIGGALGGAAIGGVVGGAAKHPWEDYSSTVAEGALWGAGIGGVGTAGMWGLGRKAVGAAKRGVSVAEEGLNRAAGTVPEEELMTPFGAKLMAKGGARAAKREAKVMRRAAKIRKRAGGSWRKQGELSGLNSGRSDKGAIGRAKRRAKAYSRLWRRRRREKMTSEMSFPSVSDVPSRPPLARVFAGDNVASGGYEGANPLSTGQWARTRLMDISRTGNVGRGWTGLYG